MSAPVDVRGVLDRVAGVTNDTFRLAGSSLQLDAVEARAAVAELIGQRDALVDVLFSLTQSLPKGRKGLSSAAQSYLRDGATLAAAIYDSADVDPEAFTRFSKGLWGSEYRTTPEGLAARRTAALARVGGAK